VAYLARIVLDKSQVLQVFMQYLLKKRAMRTIEVSGCASGRPLFMGLSRRAPTG